jgi:hypothetical protein
MKTDRRNMLLTLAALPWPIFTARLLANDAHEAAEAEKALMGPWFVAAGQVSIIISVESTGQALVLFDEGGAITIGRHVWRALPGGIVIDTLPRFRMWHTAAAADGCEARVEVESLPDDVEVSKGIRNFPRRFCMKRVNHAPVPRSLAERRLPKGWEEEKPAD